MKLIADLHIHSKFARACSKELLPENLDLWARKKGIGILGTGDFTHPGWMKELEEKLEPSESGLYTLKPEYALRVNFKSERIPVRFLFSAEIASIYKQGDKVRRIHNIVLAPSMEAAKEFSATLEKRNVNVKSDGRPIMGIHCDELVKIAKGINEYMEIIPAHAWTPHFGVFGSLSGFNSLEEAFADQAKYIFAIETGLSSDPAMNWQVQDLDGISLISNSDPHSLHRLGREANIFNVAGSKLSYTEIIRVIRNNAPSEFISTVEFFPEEGRYHLDGHRDCKFSCLPEETRRLKGVCPICGKQLLRGVLHRVEDLAHRPLGFAPERYVPYENCIPLEEVIAQTLGLGVASKKVRALYEQIVLNVTEFAVLLDLAENDISTFTTPEIAAGIMRMRGGKVRVTPGYDGMYGIVNLYTNEERQALFKRPTQMGLF